MAKPKQSPYRELGGKSMWVKVKNPEYSQAGGRAVRNGTFSWMVMSWL